MYVSGQTSALMRVDAHVAHCARNTAVSLQRNVRSVHYVLLRQTEIDDVDCLVLSQLPPSDDEVFRLHVAVDQVSRMDESKSIQLHPTIPLEPVSFQTHTTTY